MSTNTIKRNVAIVLGLVMFLASGCKKEAMKYESADYVRFQTDSAVYAFFNKGAITQDTFNVRIQLMGKLAESDREVNLVVKDSSTATLNTHYKIIRPIILRKDSNFVSAKVVLYRTADLKSTRKLLFLGLQDGSELRRANYEGNSHTVFKLRFSDKLEKPGWWDGIFTNWSETKMQFYIDVMGSDKEPNSFVQKPGAPSNGLYYTIYKLKAALVVYNATHTTPLTDQFGPISWELDWINY